MKKDDYEDNEFERYRDVEMNVDNLLKDMGIEAKKVKNIFFDGLRYSFTLELLNSNEVDYISIFITNRWRIDIISTYLELNLSAFEDMDKVKKQFSKYYKITGGTNENRV